MLFWKEFPNPQIHAESIKPIEGIPIVTGATAWDDPVTGETYILVIHEALYYRKRLDHSLINPNQIRHYGIDFWDNPYDKTKGTKIDVDDGITVGLSVKGTKILFESRAPTDQELKDCHKIHMTSKVEWNPGTVSLGSVKTNHKNDEPDGLKEQLIKAIPLSHGC